MFVCRNRAGGGRGAFYFILKVCYLVVLAIVNTNDGKRKIYFMTLFGDFQKLSFVLAPLGITFCALSQGVILE